MERLAKKKRELVYGLLDEAPVFFVAINPDGTSRYINKTMLDALGYQKKEVWHKDYLKQFVPASQHNLVQDVFISLQKEGQPTHNENIILTKNGKELLVRWYGHPIFNDTGDFQYLIGIGIDITSERNAFSELNKQLEINQLLLKTSPVGIVVVDKLGQITYANKQAEKILGLDINRLRKRKYNDIQWQITDLEGKTFPEEKLPFNLVKKYLKPFYNIEHAIKSTQGRPIFLSINAAPIFDAEGTFQGAICTLSDITAQKIKEKERERMFFQERGYRKLIEMENEMIYNLISKKDFPSKLNQVLEFISKILPHDGSDISLWEDNQLKVIAIYGYRGLASQKIVQNLRLDIKDYPLEREVIKYKKSIILSDTYEDSRWRKIPGLEWIRSAIKIPFLFEGNVIGTLGIVSEKPHAFNEKSLKKIEYFIHGLTIALNNYLNYKQLYQTRNEIILAIGKMIEFRDPYTSGHQEGVANLATAIALEMGLGEDSREAIKLASLVHDIGKIMIPSGILNKPGRLNEMEYNLIKEHCKAGYEIIRGISFPYPVAEIIYQHQERINGSGYPRGLKGNQIMLEARIIAVADVFEAMLSHRPYRPALRVEEVEQELIKNKGILYDPQVVEACLKVGRKLLTKSLLS